MNPHQALPLLAGLTPAQFIRRHWQKKPFLVRAALPDMPPPLSRNELFALAAQEEVSSRLIQRRAGRWTLDHGPFARRKLPPLSRGDWTLLVQATDQHSDAVHALLQRFRFLPDARLDDVMISYASDGGGVGPHVDSYDVFLLQTVGRRRWRIARQDDASELPGLALRILAKFVPQQEFLLAPGDMLYLPPGYAHEGVALGACMTCSIGFRAPAKRELGLELLQRMADLPVGSGVEALYRDPGQAAQAAPAQIPGGMQGFAEAAVRSSMRSSRDLAQVLGEYLSEPKASVWFQPEPLNLPYDVIVLDRRTKMLYDRRQLYVNGEGFVATGTDARLLRQLANRRHMGAADSLRLSPTARLWVDQWIEAGWVHGR